jgi:hypothetical protein
MMHVNQECRSLSSWKYRNYAKETMAIASKHQATMRMIHPQILKGTRLKHRNNNSNNNNNNSKATEMNTMNKNTTATGLIQIPETRPRVLIIVN